MSDGAWRVDELEQEPPAPVAQSPSLVALHFLLDALRRRWRLWVGLGCVGMLMGMVWAMTTPPASVGTVTLRLAHAPDVDPQQALSTDMSLLRTRTLSVEVVERLGLPMTPEAFQQSVVPLPAGSDILVLEVSGPDETAAVARTRALTREFLAFRASQVRSQLEGLTQGHQERLTSLRQQTEALSKEYDQVRASSPRDERQASALLAEQANLATRIENTQQFIDNATLQADSVIEASGVVDPPSLKPPRSELKAVALAMASGLIGATAIGVGFVLVAALTSNRLRRRDEVALALETPVRISVGGRLRPSWWPLRRIRFSSVDLGILVDALEREVSRPPKSWPTAGTAKNRPHLTARGFPPIRLALATVDTEGVGQPVVACLAARLSAEGVDVFIADLSESGGLDAALDSAIREQDDPHAPPRPVVYRPGRVPSFAPGPMDFAADLSSNQDWRDAWDKADVSLALSEVNPEVGAEHVKSWADEVIVLVAAGRSSAERLRTAGELVRAAGLRLLFAMMVGTDRTDESHGLGASPDWRAPAGRSR